MKKWIAMVLMWSILFSSVTVHAAEPKEEMNTAVKENAVEVNAVKENAVSWLYESMKENGSFGDEKIPVDTCQAVKLIRDMEKEYSGGWCTEQEELWIKDNDSASRFYCATGEEKYLEAIEGPNEDGGYGLNGNYQSDVPDTALVFEALVRKNLTDGSYEEEIAGALGYLQKHQNGDGGFSYLPDACNNDLLTLRIALTVAAYEKYGEALKNTETEYGYQDTEVSSAAESILGKVDRYFEENTYDTKDAAGFEKEAYRNAYLCLREKVNTTESMEKWLAGFQGEDGSFFGGIRETIAAIRLCQAMEIFNTPYLTVTGMETELSCYTLYFGYETKITAEAVISYRCNGSHEGILRTEVLKNGEVSECLEQSVIMEKQMPMDEEDSPYRESATDRNAAGNRTQLAISETLKIKAETEGDYRIRTTLLVDGEILYTNENSLYPQELVIEELELSAEYNGEETTLSWNDINNDICRYGYRVYRSTDGEEWESKSSWDGEESVKVLNIYPTESARNHLSDWMESNLSREGIPAGKGLFEIEKVSIDSYNGQPEKYLLDENGNYKYDVLFFGASDANSYKDLNQNSYLATQAFVDAGRGVLFGHDTVTMGWDCWHVHFSKFADQLGMKTVSLGGYVTSDKVQVVNSGFLTSYPWKIQGTLQVPTTHAYQQYTGGSLKATVWMKLVNGGAVDEATGGCADAYLFSRNQLAMIQTGNSNGQATDDERKVLANTLFYLKQLTGETEMTDRSAYDMEAPGICETGEMVRNAEGVSIPVQAEDYGSTYYYYVEALPQGMEEKELIQKSEVAEVTVTSGIKGYAFCVNDSLEPCDESSYGEILTTTDGKLIIPESLPSNAGYLHIRAVDHKGNMGEEMVLEIPRKEQELFPGGLSLFGKQDITIYCSTLNTEGEIYSGGNFTFGGSALRVGGVCSTVGKINAYAGSTVFLEKQEGAEEREMPQLSPLILKYMEAAGKQETLYAYNSTSITVPTYCNMTTGAYCPELFLDASLMCEKDINIGAGKVTLGETAPIAVYSVNGNISINSSSLQGKGVIYAPNGTVTINVSRLDFQGSIIAKRINIQGSELAIKNPAAEE